MPKNGMLVTIEEEHAVEKARYLREVQLGEVEGRTVEKMLPFYIDCSGMKDVTVIKPYKRFGSSREHVSNDLEELATGVTIETGSDPKSNYGHSVRDNTILYAPDADRIRFSQDLWEGYRVKQDQIIDFFKRLEL